MTSPSQTQVWRPYLIALLLSVLWIIVCYHETALAMVQIWSRSETFMHGFLVPPIVLWLVWGKRKQLSRLTPQPNPWFLLILVAIGFAWLLGELAAVNSLTQMAFVMLLVLTVPAVLGFSVARAIAFPLAFLFFAVPIGEFFMPQLMEWTAHFTVLALRLSGIPVYQEGLQFVIPSGSWSVVEACSGIRYLIASFTVGSLFAYLNYTSFKRRLIFIVASLLVPIAANWMRAYIIVMLGHLSSGKLAAGVDHLIYGWVFFGLVIMIMFMVGSRWSEPPLDESVVAPSRSEAAAGSRSTALWLLVVALAVISALPVQAFRTIERSDNATQPQLVFPIDSASSGENGGWQIDATPTIEWRPDYANPSTELQRTFTHGERSVGLYLGYYRNQDHTHKMISSENMLVKSSDPAWAQVASGQREIGFNHQPVTFRTADLRGATVLASAGERRLVVWQCYWINGHLTASDYKAKAYIALSRLLGQGDDSAIVILYASKDQPGGGEAALSAFVEETGGAIAESLRKASEMR